MSGRFDPNDTSRYAIVGDLFRPDLNGPHIINNIILGAIDQSGDESLGQVLSGLNLVAGSDCRIDAEAIEEHLVAAFHIFANFALQPYVACAFSIIHPIIGEPLIEKVQGLGLFGRRRTELFVDFPKGLEDLFHAVGEIKALILPLTLDDT